MGRTDPDSGKPPCGLTCASVPVERPSWPLGVDGLHGDVVGGVWEQGLQHGVVSVSRDDGLRSKNTSEVHQSRNTGRHAPSAPSHRDGAVSCSSLVFRASAAFELLVLVKV